MISLLQVKKIINTLYEDKFQTSLYSLPTVFKAFLPREIQDQKNVDHNKQHRP